eukprot:134457-Pleurochrysis_carterae.AAC.1
MRENTHETDFVHKCMAARQRLQSLLIKSSTASSHGPNMDCMPTVRLGELVVTPSQTALLTKCVSRRHKTSFSKQGRLSIQLESPTCCKQRRHVVDFIDSHPAF